MAGTSEFVEVVSAALTTLPDHRLKGHCEYAVGPYGHGIFLNLAAGKGLEADYRSLYEHFTLGGYTVTMMLRRAPAPAPPRIVTEPARLPRPGELLGWTSAGATIYILPELHGEAAREAE